MLNLLTKQQDLIREYRRYYDTVAVLSAIYYILKKEPSLLTSYIGVERDLKCAGQIVVTPDLSVLYEQRKKGLMFEFKWSLPFSEEHLEKELAKIEKYKLECIDWRNSTGKVDYHDLVLVCEIEDSTRVLAKLKEMKDQGKSDLLDSEGFAIWTWAIS